MGPFFVPFCVFCGYLFVERHLTSLILRSQWPQGELGQLSLPSSPFRLGIYPCGQLLTGQARDQVIRADLGHGIARADGGAGDVRGDDDVWQLQQGVVHPGRFGIGHVQAGCEDGAGFESVVEGFLVNNGAAGGVDEYGGAFHFVKCGRAKEAPSFLVQVGVHGDEVRVFQERVEIDLFGGQIFLSFFAFIDIVIENLHVPAGMAAFRQGIADTAHADDAERSAGEILAQIGPTACTDARR